MFVEIRDTNGHLLCRFDPERDLLEFQHRRVKTLVDLQQHRIPSVTERPQDEPSAPERDNT